tara:strand:+ start:2109 stop:2501 length:393 start_codon:yes stop_codon:yes gene_type:complete
VSLVASTKTTFVFFKRQAMLTTATGPEGFFFCCQKYEGSTVEERTHSHKKSRGRVQEVFLATAAEQAGCGRRVTGAAHKFGPASAANQVRVQKARREKLQQTPPEIITDSKQFVVCSIAIWFLFGARPAA